MNERAVLLSTGSGRCSCVELEDTYKQRQHFSGAGHVPLILPGKLTHDSMNQKSNVGGGGTASSCRVIQGCMPSKME